MTTQQIIARLSPLTDRVRRDVRAEKFKDGPRAQRLPLDTEALHNHAHGSNQYGAYPMDAGTSTTRVGLLDLDSHKGELSFADVCKTLEQLSGFAYAMGLIPTCFRSSGGSGAHMIFLWKTPQEARDVRAALTALLSEAYLSNGTKGLVNAQVEVFPKQDKVGEGEWGNMFVLPLAGKSVPICPVMFEPETRDAPFEFAFSRDVPKTQKVKTPPQPAPATDDLHVLQDALASIPNDGEGLPYAEWLECIFGIHYATNGSDEGKALAEQFSARSDKFDAEFFDERIWAYVKDGSLTPDRKLVTAASIFWRARKTGWGPSAHDDFMALLERFEKPHVDLSEPVDLWATEEPPEVKPDSAPDFLHRFADHYATVRGQDPAGYLLFAVGAVASAIPLHVRVNPARREPSFTTSCNLWCVAIGGSGIGKTPILNAPLSPLATIHEAEAARHASNMAQWNDDLKFASKEDKLVLLSKKPVFTPSIINNSTTEYIFDACTAAYPNRSVLFKADELSGWICGMGQYKVGASSDRADLLQGYNGDPFTVGRKSGVHSIPRFALSVMGCTQPEVAQRVLVPGAEDGMMARFLTVVLRGGSPSGEHINEDMAQLSHYGAMFPRLRNLPEMTIRFDESAQRLFDESAARARRLADTETSSHMAMWLYKWQTHLARVACAMHLAKWAWADTDPDNFLGEDVPPEINLDTMTQACRFVGWLMGHARNFYDQNDQMSLKKHLRNIGAMVLQRDRKEDGSLDTTLTRRELDRHMTGWVRLEPREQGKIINALHSAGWLVADVSARRSAKRGFLFADGTAWAINPAVFDMFNDQKLKEEQLRRQRAADLESTDLY